MRYIFIVLFLVSFGLVSMGGVGDVYYCESVRYISISHGEEEVTVYKNLKFKYKIDLNSEITFSENNPFFTEKFKTMKMEFYNPENGFLRAVNIDANEYIFAGLPPKMIGAFIGLDLVFSFTALCEKF